MDLATARPPLPETSPLAALDRPTLRKCLGRFPTGVTVVTYALDGTPRGATVNSFTSVSMDPPLILVAIGRAAKAADGLRAAPFVVNVLSRDQLDVAFHFAGRPQPELVIPWDGARETPRLRGCAARLACEPWQSVEAGDHILFLGRVIECEHCETDTLLFHGGQFRSVGKAVQARNSTQQGGQR